MSYPPDNMWIIKHNFIEHADKKIMSQKTVLTDDLEFNEQQLIWGKVTGHPWWPGIITIIPDLSSKKLYRVDFFGDPPTHSILPSTKILKYQQYSKTLNQGRLGPQLKRAMFEASIFQNTIEESKNCVDPREPSTIASLYQNNFAFPPLLRVVEKETAVQNKFFGKQISILKSPISEETVVHNIKGYQRQKKIIKRGRIKKIKFNKKQKPQKISRREKKQLMEQLLKKYKLDNIPKPYREEERSEKPLDIQKLVLRKLYKILRKNTSTKQALSKTMSLKGKITSCFQLKDVIEAINSGRELNDY